MFILNRKLGWRLGLQAVTGVLVLAFFLSAVYRSASLYHPQRRAILHLKNQRRKVSLTKYNYFWLAILNFVTLHIKVQNSTPNLIS